MKKKRVVMGILLLLLACAAVGYGVMQHRQAAQVAATRAKMSAWPGQRLLTNFALTAPNAKQVYLAGEMTDWGTDEIAMTRGTDGVWRTSVNLPTGQWLYKFVVDGEWIADPANPLSDQDGHGGRHSFIFVGDGDWMVPADAPRGVVKTFKAPSGTLTNLYLPPNYQAGQSYPLLVMLHGSNMDADQWYKTGMVDRFMDSMIAKGKIKPFIVVMPSSGGDDYSGPSENAIISQLLPQLKKEYGVSLKTSETAITGSSMGGFGAFYLAQRHPDMFGLSIPVSGFFSQHYLSSLPRPLHLPFRLQILCGSSDFLLDGNRALNELLKTDGVSFDYRESVGAHEWHYWNAQLPGLLSRSDAFFQTGR